MSEGLKAFATFYLVVKLMCLYTFTENSEVKGQVADNTGFSLLEEPEEPTPPSCDFLKKRSTVEQNSNDSSIENNARSPREFDDCMMYITTCPENIEISWLQESPFVFIGDTTKKNKENTPIVIKGIFVDIVGRAVGHCCKRNSRIRPTIRYLNRASNRRDLQLDLLVGSADMIIPMHSDEVKYRGTISFVKILDSPGVVLILRYSPVYRWKLVLKAVLETWPVVITSFLMSLVAGVVIWLLDKSHNPKEFSAEFHKGVFQGFWWAFVTMTTVGYGDRSPKSALGRVFCILWIITGVIIISIFTALVTASLSASTVQVFKIHGSKIGAVNGSEEFKLGVTMNADMEVFPHVMKITEALLAHKIDGALVDNYVITHSLKLIQKEPIRIERYIDHQITYGVVLAKNSSKLEKCFRRFLHNHPQEVFEIIAENLVPLKNPTDDENQQLKAAEGLFYQEDVFEMVMYVGLGVAVAFFVGGIVWEFLWRRPKIKNQQMQFAPKGTYSVSDEEVKLHPCDNGNHSRLDDMITEYQLFHDRWIEGLKKLRDKELAADQASNGRTATNGDADMVAV